MHHAGVENVVASSGTALTQGQIRLIHRFTSNITVLYDGDAAGIKAALRGIDLLLEDGMNVKVVLLPDGEDPDSFAASTMRASLPSLSGRTKPISSVSKRACYWMMREQTLSNGRH